MICYALACKDGHEFESWFPSADAFDALLAARRLSCPECGSKKVSKALMAPGIGGAKSGTSDNDAPLSTPRNAKEEALAEIRAKIEANSDYVGMNFASEARAMHEGETPKRSIYGEAKLEEAKELLDEGIPVAPLPFAPRSRAN